MIEELRLDTLVEDPSLYPRNSVDETHVADLARALASGATLPPIIAEAATLRIVDGYHRRRALLKFLGSEAIAPVELREYEAEKDLFLEAVGLNSIHGRRLDRHDQTKIVLRLRELGIEDREISIRLHVPEPIVQKLAVRVVFDIDDHAQPSKRGLEHMQGQRLSSEQLSAVSSVRSAEAGRLCIELTKLLENRLVNLDDKSIIGLLRRLVGHIESALESVAAA